MAPVIIIIICFIGETLTYSVPYRLIKLKANSHGAMCSDNLYAILVVTSSHLRLVHGNNSVWPTKVVTIFPFTRCDSAKPNKLSLQIVPCESILMANSHGAICSDNFTPSTRTS